MSRPRIVIVGGGFGGAYCAQALEPLARRGAIEVLLVDRNNYFVFYPLLVEAGTGNLQPRHVVVSIRSFLRFVRFRMAEVTGVDTARKTVGLQDPVTGRRDELPYDHLVLASGSVTRLPRIPGLREFGHEIKGLADAVSLRDRAIELLEAADGTTDTELRRLLLHWVVVGANFTGVEVAGEFEVFLRQAARRYPNLRPSDVRITLVEVADRILPALDSDLSDYAALQLRRRGVDLRLGTSVREIDSRQVRLDSGESLDAGTVIWCAGIAPNPLLAELPLPKDERGYLLCDPDLRVRGFDDIWAIGDCAVNPDPDGRAYPATAQHAVRQGVALARNLERSLRGEPPRPFIYRSAGALAALGCRTGVARVFGWKLSGFPAWFLWRTVYLFKMPGWWRRARVALDWTMDLFFPREFVQLGWSRRSREREATRRDGASPGSARPPDAHSREADEAVLPPRSPDAHDELDALSGLDRRQPDRHAPDLARTGGG